MKCGECDYWDKKYDGVFKPCKHPNSPINLNGFGYIRYTEDKECEIERINKLFNKFDK